MKFAHWIPIGCLFVGNPMLGAEEPAPEVAGLQKAAADFVVAYNDQDAAALAKLFTGNGEITDLRRNQLIAGRADIEAHYERVFAENPRLIAIEVTSLRLVAPHLAIEDGFYHLTPADDESSPPESFTFTAVLTRTDGGNWHIASTRTLEEVTEPAGHLAPLAEFLMGEWTHKAPDGIRLDLAFGWDASGNHLTGETLTTRADAEPQHGNVRITYDASKKHIVSWIYDSNGGFNYGTWTPTHDGWVIHTHGTTADGETLVASQKITRQGADTLNWSSTHRIIGGQSAPDVSMRLVRQAPAPAED